MDESPVWRISHGQATCQRRTLATHRTALASTQASSLPVPRRKPLDYRKVLTGIIFVLKTGIPWEQLPQEMGCGCGMTCLNYLNAWQRAGVWEKLHQILLAELEQADKLDWSCAAVDSAKARALGGGDQTGPNPTDRGKPGTKHHVLTEGQGMPLVTHSTGANVPDVKGVIAPVPGIMRLFWAFSSSNPPESPSQEDSSLANMLDTLEARCRSDGPPAGPRSIDPLPGSRSFLTVSAVA